MTVFNGTDVAETIEGSEYSDRIMGADGDDFLAGSYGKDEVQGEGGNDILYAGQNLFDQILFSDTEAVEISFSDYDNSLSGGDGDDRLIGGALNDLAAGEEGNDSLGGYLGDDKLLGGNGDDLIKGNLGADILIGEDGDDILFGESNDDSLIGGEGNDLFYGNNDYSLSPKTDIDYFTGGRGEDTFVLGTTYTTFYEVNQSDDLAVIEDFESDQDVIQLQGEAQDYSLEVGVFGTETEGTYLYSGDIETHSAFYGAEPIAFVASNINLDLAAIYFDFV